MGTIKFSTNKKTQKWCKMMYDNIIYSMGNGSKKQAISEIKRYKSEFPREKDYNIVQYGNLNIYYGDVRDDAKKAGYSKSTIDKMSDEKIWDWYKRTCRYVVNEMLKNNK